MKVVCACIGSACLSSEGKATAVLFLEFSQLRGKNAQRECLGERSSRACTALAQEEQVSVAGCGWTYWGCTNVVVCERAPFRHL